MNDYSKSQKNIKLSIILPAHNEGKNLPIIINQLFKDFSHLFQEIIIVDDCSADSTPEIAEELARKYGRIRVIHRSPPSGLGRAIRAGFMAASGDYLLTIDSDLEMSPRDIPRMLSKLNSTECDVVVGSRFTERSVLEGYSRIKYIYNRAYNRVFRQILGMHISDLTFGFKVLKNEVVQSVRWESVAHGIAAETTLKPIVLGFKVEEVPVSWISRKYGKSTFRFSYNFEYLKVGIKAVFIRLRRALQSYFKGCLEAFREGHL